MSECVSVCVSVCVCLCGDVWAYEFCSSNPDIDITRRQLDEAGFEAGFISRSRSRLLRQRLRTLLPPEPVRSALTPPLSLGAWVEFVLVHVPILRWVLEYRHSTILMNTVHRTENQV